MKTLTLTLGTAALALGLALAGCASPTEPVQPTQSDAPAAAAKRTAPSTADEIFVTMMIPHHQQAIEMSELILAKNDIGAPLRELAEDIKAAQGPEIERMLGWLDDWGFEYDPDDDMAGMDHGGMSHDEAMGNSGMMSETEMTALQQASGTDASRIFLDQMIRHHEGAVEMARTALTDARTPEVRELAQQVIDDQTAEIEKMQGMLTQL